MTTRKPSNGTQRRIMRDLAEQIKELSGSEEALKMAADLAGFATLGRALPHTMAQQLIAAARTQVAALRLLEGRS